MALHAGLELPLAVESSRICDRLAASLDVLRLDRIDVSLTGPVAALAVDPFGQRAGEDRAIAVIGHRRARVSVVARQAVLVDEPAKILMHGFVVARAHRPIAGSRALLPPPVFRVPAHWHLEKSPV